MHRLVPVLSLFAIACTPPLTSAEIAAFAEGSDFGRMSGEVPIVGAFDAPARGGLVRELGWNDEPELALDIDALDEGGWIMLGGAFDLEPLVENEWVRFNDREHWVYGCSGPSYRSVRWDRDVRDLRVKLDRIETPDGPANQYSIEAYLGGSEIRSVVVEPAQPAPQPGSGDQDD